MDQPARGPEAAADPPPPKIPRLQRVLASYRNRDWVGISIELAVVVLGILIAFQIGQWGDQRERAREEREFLGRLHAEYGRGVQELESVIEDHARVTSQYSAAFRAADNPAVIARMSRTRFFGCAAIRYRAAPFNDTAFEELVSSGRISLISDPSLRAEIRDLTTAQAAASKQSLSGRELLLEQGPALDSHYRYGIDRDGQVVCYLNWTGLMRDPRAVNAAVRIYRVHQTARDERLKVLEMTRRLQGHLACKLDKPECRR